MVITSMQVGWGVYLGQARIWSLEYEVGFGFAYSGVSVGAPDGFIFHPIHPRVEPHGHHPSRRLIRDSWFLTRSGGTLLHVH
jgi:hypothetical protein